MKKRYYNSETKEWYTEGNSLTRRVNGALFSGVPSEEQLTDWGFVEWVEPTPTPTELLERAKANKIAELEAYDDSDAVNSFDIVMDGKTTSAWIEPDKRSNYRGSLEDCELLKVTDIEVPIAGMLIPMTVADARVKLAQVQLYADRCTIVTEGHKYAINALTSVEEVEAYDYKTGYPERLNFSVIPNQ
jgi:hypothetical protein